MQYIIDTVEIGSVVNLITTDHLGGFDIELNNHVLDYASSNQTTKKKVVSTEYIFDNKVKQKYKNIEFDFLFDLNKKLFLNYKTHPELTFKNFVCSFNGSEHVSRKLLVSILNKFNWFNLKYCSKNFVYSDVDLDGHIGDYTNDKWSFYRKFFISDSDNNIGGKVNNFNYKRFDHSQNIYTLQSKLTESFLHVVSESIATSYYPFVTEKFLYSVVTRGLFLAYAQPGWHRHLEKYYGFKLYTNLFDYRFDDSQNPVERLVELISMLSKFSMLSTDDWRDLYLMQQDEIEYNYNHYFSGDYIKQLYNNI